MNDEVSASFELLVLLLQLFPVFLLVVTYFIGRNIEKGHLESLRQRERATLSFPFMTIEEPPSDLPAGHVALVTGSVVISVDYFKRFLSALRAIVGGEVKSYTPLLDRARREALQRMKETAIAGGFDAVINVRLETSRLASGRRDGKGVAGVEMLAFGTAVKRAA